MRVGAGDGETDADTVGDGDADRDAVGDGTADMGTALGVTAVGVFGAGRDDGITATEFDVAGAEDISVGVNSGV